MSQCPQPIPKSLGDDRIIIGIDWADREHVVCTIDPQRLQPLFHTLAHQPEAIAQWAAELRARYPDRPLCVSLETSQGPLFQALLAAGGFTLFPVNPKQLARFRQVFSPTGKKDDRADAGLLARLLLQHPEQLRACHPDDELTRRLARLTELRRTLVEQQKACIQQLAAALKLYFPLLVQLFGGKLQQPLVLALLQRWPTLSALRRASPATLRKELAAHGVRHPERQDELIRQFRAAAPLTEDAALIEPQAAYAQHLARQLAELARTIGQFESDITEATAAHPDAPLFRSLPGAGNALVPRLIAALGSDRDRYESAEELQNLSGIAPVTIQSGQSRRVQRRRACPKFLRQTFHEFADHARRWSSWSKAWYDHKRAAGMKHQAAVRALAYKWIRIIFRLWKQRELYSEARYIEALLRSRSPIAPALMKSAIQA
jgi:transposase